MIFDSTAQLEPKESPKKGKQTILIVDDDPGQVDALTLRLEKQDYLVAKARCGRDGIELARGKRPDLILLDLRLPDIDGLEVCVELADDRSTCVIPVIILSGVESADIVRRSRAAGCQYYIRKPYDPNVLLMLIQDTLRDELRDEW